jgi:hypothetical protein
MFVQKRVLGVFLLIALGLSLTAIPDAFADKKNLRQRHQEGVNSAVEKVALSGTVTEVFHDSGNTFLLIKSKSKESRLNQWAVIPYTDLQVGDRVELQSGIIKKNYHMKSLKRNFRQIVFSPGLVQ